MTKEKWREEGGGGGENSPHDKIKAKAHYFALRFEGDGDRSIVLSGGLQVFPRSFTTERRPA
jgi:hypothetical protein